MAGDCESHTLRHHDDSFINSSRILPMAPIGFSPFGQTQAQLPILRQRNTLKGSSRSWSRSMRARSRLSSRKRKACNSAEGPRYFSGFHHQDGHCDVQQPQRMHSYRPSSSLRSSGYCRRSIAGAGSSLISHGLICS